MKAFFFYLIQKFNSLPKSLRFREDRIKQHDINKSKTQIRKHKTRIRLDNLVLWIRDKSLTALNLPLVNSSPPEIHNGLRFELSFFNQIVMEDTHTVSPHRLSERVER